MVDGDESAYREFYDAYFNRLARYLLVVSGGNEEAAREALQAAMVRIVRHANFFSNEVSFWNWLALIARNALKDQHKKQRRYFAFLNRFGEHARAQVAADDGKAEARLMALLDDNLAALLPDERDLLERKYFAAQPVRDIAEDLQVSEKAVESRLTRLRRKLKKAMLTSLKHETSD